jgi:hypothetical protein
MFMAAEIQDRYTVFIDESGEAGIGRVRSETSGGASPYMTLGAALIHGQDRSAIEKSLGDIAGEFGKKALHCSKLRHYQLVHFARKITRHNMRLFGVISRKATLGTYKKSISENSNLYYNKCAQYLLERVGWFMEARGINPENLDIVFEKANFDYNKMRNFLWACQSNPKHVGTQKLKHIAVSRISVKDKKDEPLLQIGDLVAHALYRCVDKTALNYGITEPRYLRELGPHFFGHPDTNAVAGAGLYCVHSVDHLNVDSDVAEVMNGLVATPPYLVTSTNGTRQSQTRQASTSSASE